MNPWQARGLSPENRAKAAINGIPEIIAEAIVAAEQDAKDAKLEDCVQIAEKVRDEFTEMARRHGSGVPFLQATGGRDAAAEIVRRMRRTA